MVKKILNKFFRADEDGPSERSLVQEGRFEAAGDLRARRDDLEAALSYYERAKAWIKAGHTARRLGDHGEAGAFFERAGELKLAVAAYEAAGDEASVARLAPHIGDPTLLARAAQWYRAQGQMLPAAELFKRAGRLSDAEACLFEAGGRKNLDRVIAMYRHAYQQRKAAGSGAQLARSYALRAAVLLFHSGRAHHAVQVGRETGLSPDDFKSEAPELAAELARSLAREPTRPSEPRRPPAEPPPADEELAMESPMESIGMPPIELDEEPEATSDELTGAHAMPPEDEDLSIEAPIESMDQLFDAPTPRTSSKSVLGRIALKSAHVDGRHRDSEPRFPGAVTEEVYGRSIVREPAEAPVIDNSPPPIEDAIIDEESDAIIDDAPPFDEAVIDDGYDEAIIDDDEPDVVITSSEAPDLSIPLPTLDRRALDEDEPLTVGPDIGGEAPSQAHDSVVDALMSVLDRNQRVPPKRLSEAGSQRITAVEDRQEDEDSDDDERDSQEFSKDVTSRYSIQERIGTGGMGEVYKARDLSLGRIVALKLLTRGMVGDGVAQRFFLREARAAAALNHPSIVTIYDIGVLDDRPFISMEYIEGRDLSTRLIEEGALPLGHALNLTVQLAVTLDYAHKRNVVHRDVKPPNVMECDDGGVKILDFGLAKAIQGDDKKSTLVAGTPEYMSPEQLAGLEVDGRTDIFSLGVLLYEILTDEVPFEGALRSGDYRPATSCAPWLPEGIDEVLSRALEVRAADRYQNARELAAALRRLMRSS